MTIYVGPKGQKLPVETACHECWQCRENAINDWVGRNIAESKTALASHAVTLTYGRSRRGEVDHERAAILTYSDVQKYLKLLRRHGFPVRYFVTGEYGSTKGRAHWHIMLYWQRVNPLNPATHGARSLVKRWFPGGTAYWDDKPSGRRLSKPWAAGEIPLDCDWNDDNHWPHGFSFWTAPTHRAIRYNCKYIQKDQGEAERQGHMAMSKKPPIGADYFAMLAEKYVQQGIAPQNLEYSFPEVRNKDGEIIRFQLRDRSAELFLDHYLATWQAVHRSPPPPSELLALYEEYGRVVSPDLVRLGVVRSAAEEREPSARQVLAPYKEAIRARAAAELSALIDEGVLPQHLQLEAGNLEYHRPRQVLPDGSAILEARWRYDSVARKWRRLHWTYGKGWQYGKQQ